MISFLIFSIDHGYEITYKSSDDSTLQIVKYGEYLYENIIIFAPTTKGNRNLFVLLFCF
jgi:oligosaccharyltransferase complex subunit beta